MLPSVVRRPLLISYLDWNRSDRQSNGISNDASAAHTHTGGTATVVVTTHVSIDPLSLSIFNVERYWLECIPRIYR